MQEIFSTLCQYFSYPFVVYAFIVGLLVALCSSLLGTTLVLKRFSYIGDGLSHIAFGTLAVALVLDITNTNYIVFPLTALAAILLLKMGSNSKLNGDAAIAMLSVGSLAIGYLLLNMFPVSTNLAGDVCSSLFGAMSILTLSEADVITSLVLSVFVLLVFIIFYNRIFAITFDDNFAKATGLPANRYNLLIAITIAAVIVVSMNLVGALLISALVIFPALSAMRLFRTYKSVILASLVISLACASVGLLASILLSTPVGASIVVANIIAYLISWAGEKVLRK